MWGSRKRRICERYEHKRREEGRKARRQEGREGRQGAQDCFSISQDKGKIQKTILEQGKGV